MSRIIEYDEDIMTLRKNNTDYFILKDIKVRKLFICGKNIRFDLRSYTLFVKEIIVEGQNIQIYSSTEKPARITNMFEISNGEIMKTLSEIHVLCKDLNLMISKRCHIRPKAVLFVTNTRNFRLNNINMSTEGTAIETKNSTETHIVNGCVEVRKGTGISIV